MKKIFTLIAIFSIISIVIQSDVIAQSAEGMSDRMEIEEDVSISAFPNPTVDFIEFHASGNELIAEVQIFDMIGNKVFAKDFINQPKYVFERGELKNGIYIYSVKSATGKARTGRITLK